MLKLKKRNFFNKIFGNKINDQPKKLTNVQMLNSYTNSVSNWSGNIYENDTVRSCIDAISRHFAKMQPEHRLKNKVVNSNLNKLLSYRPNDFMSTYDFLYKTVSCLLVNNTAFIYIDRDDLGMVKALFPVEFNKSELKQDENSIYYLSFQFYNGKNIVVDTADVIILRRHFYSNDFFGDSNYSALYPSLNLLHCINEGSINAVKNSAVLRGILSLEGMIQPEDRTKQKNEFMKEYLSLENNSGIAVTDSTSKYTPIESKPIYLDSDTKESATKNIYNYFGINENIINGKFSDNEYQAFYEAILEPLAIQFSQEFTAKMFSQREQEFGNEIIFVADRLSYLSTDSKVRMLLAVKELGIASLGTIADIFNLPQPPDADKYLQSLNYVNSQIADKYQLKEDKKGGENNDDTKT